MLCSCIETSLDVKVACKQTWGKQLLLLVLWTSTRKQEGFDLSCRGRFTRALACLGWSQNLDAGRLVPVEGCAKAGAGLG